jgi:hypothetical protein
MRYYVFLTLTGAALILDALLFGLSVPHPRQPGRAGSPVALAAPPNTSPPTRRPIVNDRAATLLSRPTATPAPTATSVPTATPTPPPTLPPTATPEPPPRLLAEHAASFTPSDRAMRANIRLALSYYDGALTHVFVAPGGTFSFNAALGIAPQRLPWKYVTLKQTAVPPAAEGATPAPPSAEELRRIQGGGLCDLASRYVMAARPLLPARAFRFVNHIRSSGIRLQGVPARDSVSIWAVGGQAGEQDLKITNVTDGWLEFVVERDGEKITVRARLWDRLPPP